MSRQRKQGTTTEKADLYDLVMPLLEAMYEEFKAFSKKRPDGAVSKPKMLVTNRLLQQCRTVLESEPSLELLDLLDEDNVPQNSDVILMLSQYVAAMKQFRKKYLVLDGLEWRWFTED